MIIELKKEENLEEVLNEELTLVDYYADWCGPCKMLAVELEALTNVEVIKVNTDEHQELAMKKGIMSIPYVEIYKNNEVVNKFTGFKPSDEIEDILKEINN